MKTYLILFAACLSQFASHFTDQWIDREFGPGWSQLVKYSLGVMVAAPFIDMMMAEYEIPAKYRKIMMLCFFVVFFVGAIGTLAGWLVRESPIKEMNGNGEAV